MAQPGLGHQRVGGAQVTGGGHVGRQSGRESGATRPGSRQAPAGGQQAEQRRVLLAVEAAHVEAGLARGLLEGGAGLRQLARRCRRSPPGSRSSGTGRGRRPARRPGRRRSAAHGRAGPRTGTRCVAGARRRPVPAVRAWATCRAARGRVDRLHHHRQGPAQRGEQQRTEEVRGARRPGATRPPSRWRARCRRSGPTPTPPRCPSATGPPAAAGGARAGPPAPRPAGAGPAPRPARRARPVAVEHAVDPDVGRRRAPSPRRPPRGPARPAPRRGRRRRPGWRGRTRPRWTDTATSTRWRRVTGDDSSSRCR